MSKSQLIRLSAQVPEIAALIKENQLLREALVQIESVCVDNEPDTCNKGMALNFVRDVAREALRNE